MHKVGKHLTNTTEAIVVFESATPNWKDNKIRLNKVHVVSMPRSIQKEFIQGTQEGEPNVVQGDLLAGVELDQDEKGRKNLKRMPWFDLTIDTLEVELSLVRLIEGKGIVVLMLRVFEAFWIIGVVTGIKMLPLIQRQSRSRIHLALKWSSCL